MMSVLFDTVAESDVYEASISVDLESKHRNEAEDIAGGVASVNCGKTRCISQVNAVATT